MDPLARRGRRLGRLGRVVRAGHVDRLRNEVDQTVGADSGREKDIESTLKPSDRALDFECSLIASLGATEEIFVQVFHTTTSFRPVGGRARSSTSMFKRVGPHQPSS